jgi:hypothetical protein
MHLVAAGSTGLFSGFITGSKGIIGPTALQSGAIFALVTIVSNAAIRILQAYGIHPNWGMKCLLDVAVFTLISLGASALGVSYSLPFAFVSLISILFVRIIVEQPECLL